MRINEEYKEAVLSIDSIEGDPNKILELDEAIMLLLGIFDGLDASQTWQAYLNYTKNLNL